MFIFSGGFELVVFCEFDCAVDGCFLLLYVWLCGYAGYCADCVYLLLVIMLMFWLIVVGCLSSWFAFDIICVIVLALLLRCLG